MRLIVVGQKCMALLAVCGLIMVPGCASAQQPVQLRFDQAAGTVLEYQTTSSNKLVEASETAKDGTLKRIVLPTTVTMDWQIVVTSRDDKGISEVVMPVLMRKKYARGDMKAAGAVPFGKTKNFNEDFTKDHSTVLTMKVSALGKIIEEPALFTGSNFFTWMHDVLPMGPGITLLPYPEQAVSAGNTWVVPVQPAYSSTQTGPVRDFMGLGWCQSVVKTIDVALLAFEIMDGRQCMKMEYTMHSDPNASEQFTKAIQTVWIDVDGGFPVKSILDLEFHLRDSDQVQTLHSETVLKNTEVLPTNQLQAASLFYTQVRSILTDLESSMTDPESSAQVVPRGQRFKAMKESLDSASIKAPRGQWKQALEGLREDELHVESLTKHVDSFTKKER